ncbi:MAG: hypothetical protein ACRERC_21100, partial [Candidatus Binatia bacterium]
LFLTPLSVASDWFGAQFDDPDDVLALAAFSSFFKLGGIVVFYPWLDRFAQLIERLSGPGRESAVSRLEPALAEAGGPVALEAAWRAILEIAAGAVGAVRGRLAGEALVYAPAAEAMQHTEHFLASLSLETTDLCTIAPRLVRLCHALDHLRALDADLLQSPPAPSDWQPPAGFAAGARALATWLDASRPPAVAAAAIVSALEAAALQLRGERTSGRAQLLEEVALQRLPAAGARAQLDALAWADTALHHAWRLADSLRLAAAGS